MWLIFGVIAITATFINLYRYKTGKNYQVPMIIGLSFTALTLVASYSMISENIIAEDWASLLDVVPTMSVAFWILTVISIFLNIIPTFLDLKNKR